MGNRPVKTKYWIKFLQAHGYTHVRTKASHDHYTCPNSGRTITFRSKDKEIPPLHLRTNLFTMNKDLEYLYLWIEDNC